MDRSEAPSADTAMLLYLLAATSAVVVFTPTFFTVVMAPTIIASTPKTLPRSVQSPILLDPTAFQARMDSERLAVAKANEMNGQLGLKITRRIDQPAPAFAEVLHKQKRAPQARRITHLARVPSDAGRNVKTSEPQTFYVSWW